MQNSEADLTRKRNKILLDEYKIIKERCNIIQSKYLFKIPNYILEEIVRFDKTRNNAETTNLLINLAMINNRITIEQAEILRKDFVKNKNIVKI